MFISFLLTMDKLKVGPNYSMLPLNHPNNITATAIIFAFVLCSYLSVSPAEEKQQLKPIVIFLKAAAKVGHAKLDIFVFKEH